MNAVMERVHCQAFKECQQFLDFFPLCCLDELARANHFRLGGSLENRHARGGDAARMNLIEHGGGGLAACLATTPAAQPDDREGGVVDAGLVQAMQLL